MPRFTSAADLGLIVPTGAPAIDTLAALTQALAWTVAEVARELKVTERTVRAWIADERRPGGRNRVALAALLRDQRHRWLGRSDSVARDALFAQLLVALQTPAERRRWLANREALRGQFAAVW